MPQNPNEAKQDSVIMGSEKKRIMEMMVEFIEATFPNMGFIMILAPFQEKSVGAIASNVKREDIIEQLRSLADKFEKGDTIPALLPDENRGEA